MIKKNNLEKEIWAESLKNRRNLTFSVNEDIYKSIPPFPREITLDINNRCNHTR